MPSHDLLMLSKRAPLGDGEHQVAALPLSFPAPQHLQRLGADRDTPRLSAFGRLAQHGQQLARQVDAGPLQAEQLATAQAGIHRHQHDRHQVVGVGIGWATADGLSVPAARAMRCGAPQAGPALLLAGVQRRTQALFLRRAR